MAQDNKITLYDLQVASGATISPFVWATKYALAHKGFDVEIVPGGFTGIPERTGGKTERLPAIVDDGQWVLDSWLIAEYLDEKYPDRPTLIGDPSVKVCGQMLEQWLWATAIGPWMTCYLKSYRDRSLECDHAYVTETRERMFGGMKLEDIIIGREDRLPQIPPKLELMRGTVRRINGITMPAAQPIANPIRESRTVTYILRNNSPDWVSVIIRCTTLNGSAM